jgi:proteasome lid subunit RPN8/RPN11
MIIDNQEIKDFIINDTINRRPNEACGLVLDIDNKLKVFSCENSAKDTKNRFKISRELINSYSKQGKIIGFYHSHKEQGLSQQDSAVLSKLNLISIVCNIDNLDIQEYNPTNNIPNILNRPFIAGVLDCVELIKDIYKKDLNINIPDLIHEIRNIDWDDFESCVKNSKYSEWNNKNYTFLKDFYLNNGFIEISQDQLREYDLILFRFPFCETATHVMLYRNEKIIHHPFGKDSLIEDYNKYYRKYSVNYLRYKDFA